MTIDCRHLGRIRSTRTVPGLPDLTVWQCEADWGAGQGEGETRRQGDKETLPLSPPLLVSSPSCVPLKVDLERLPGMRVIACEGCPLFVTGGKRMSKAAKAVSLGKTMAKTAVRKVLTGEALASLEVIQERSAICNVCPHNVAGSCSKCDCSTVGGRVLSNKLAHASAVCGDTPPRWAAVK